MAGIVIIGAGGHGQVVADILLVASRVGASAAPLGFLDDDPALAGTRVLGLPVLGPIASLAHVEHDGVVLALGDNRRRHDVLVALRERGVRFANAIHPAAVVAADVRLGAGVMVCAGAVVNTGSVVADGVILNTGCTVDHHNRIDAYAHIAPGAHLGGAVRIGLGALVGIGSCVTPGRSIGEWTVVGAGSTVTRDLPPYCTAVGSPARVIKRHAEVR